MVPAPRREQAMKLRFRLYDFYLGFRLLLCLTFGAIFMQWLLHSGPLTFESMKLLPLGQAIGLVFGMFIHLHLPRPRE